MSPRSFLGCRAALGGSWLLLAAAIAVVLGLAPAGAQEPAAATAPAGACVGDSPAADPQRLQGGLSSFARADVKAIAEQVTCYCGCPHLQVSKCFCGTADAIRDDIAAQLDRGMTPEAIIAAYVEQHGTWVLAEPPKRGFNWIIWIGPGVLIVAGALVLLAFGRRWARGVSAPATTPLDPAVEARLRAELDSALERER